MVEKNQQFIYNTQELSLIKNTFAENDTLLYTIRKVLLQFELSDGDKTLIKSAITPEVLASLKKRILPDLSPEYPLGQIPSLLTTLTEHIKAKDVAEMSPQFKAKLIEQKYLQQGFAQLEAIAQDKPVPPSEIILTNLGELEGKSDEQAYIDMTAYLFLLGYVDPSLIMIRSIAGDKAETVEKQKERMTRNSSK